MLKPIGRIGLLDLRLPSLGFSALSGLVVTFAAFIHTSALVAVMCSAIALAVGLVIGRFALPPWRGTHRDQVILLSVSVVWFVLVVAVVVLI